MSLIYEQKHIDNNDWIELKGFTLNHIPKTSYELVQVDEVAIALEVENNKAFFIISSSSHRIKFKSDRICKNNEGLLFNLVGAKAAKKAQIELNDEMRDRVYGLIKKQCYLM